MIYDFSQVCKTYKKNFYTADFFTDTSCPKCGAIGRFKLYGSYARYIIYFSDFKVVNTAIDIKRIMCKSCKTTHAVLPGDIIAYELLSLFVFLFVLISFHIKKVPVLRMASKLHFSFQFIYATLNTFVVFVNSIHQFFKETSPGDTSSISTSFKVLELIKLYNPYTQFQYNYIKLNKRPCFMCKFFTGGKHPPVGIIRISSPLKGSNITIE